MRVLTLTRTYNAIPFNGRWALAKCTRDGAVVAVEMGMSRQAARTLAHRLNTGRITYGRR